MGRKLKTHRTDDNNTGMLRRVIPAPRTCLMLALILFSVAGAMATTSFVLRKRVDDFGNVTFDSAGHPMYEVDQWASFWNGWLSNIPWVTAQFFLIFGVALWIRSKCAAAKSRHLESKQIAQQAAASDGDKPPI